MLGAAIAFDVMHTTKIRSESDDLDHRIKIVAPSDLVEDNVNGDTKKLVHISAFGRAKIRLGFATAQNSVSSEPRKCKPGVLDKARPVLLADPTGRRTSRECTSRPRCATMLAYNTKQTGTHGEGIRNSTRGQHTISPCLHRVEDGRLAGGTIRALSSLGVRQNQAHCRSSRI